MKDIFNMGDSPEEPEATGPERKPCPECGKEVTWTQAGKPRSHKCTPKPEEPEGESEQPKAPEGLIDRAITAYLETKAELELEAKLFADAMAPRNELQAKRLTFLGNQLKDAGLTSQSGSMGRSEVYHVDSATVSDPLIFGNWVGEDYANRKHYLENRVSKTACKQDLEDSKTLPPGVNFIKIEKVKVVRKPKSK